MKKPKKTKKSLLLDYTEWLGGTITWTEAVDFLLYTKGMKLNYNDETRGHYSSYFSDSYQATAILLRPSKNDCRFLVKISKGLYQIRYDGYVTPKKRNWD